MDELEGPSDWKKRQEAINQRMKGVAKKSGSDIAKTISERKERKSDKSISENSELLMMLCHEAQDQLREGKMTLKEVVKDLKDALDALVDSKPEKEEE